MLMNTAHLQDPQESQERRLFLRRAFFTAGALSANTWLVACGGGGEELPVSAPTDSMAPPGSASPATPPATLPATPAAPPPAPVPPPPLSPTSPFAKLSALQPADANGVMLPVGFSSRIVARSGQEPVPGGSKWHPGPDGGAVFAAPDGGWVYVSNSEYLTLYRGSTTGGASALRFNAQGDLSACYRVLKGTNINCAGGPTPWGTWLSCEEYEVSASQARLLGITRGGQVWECDPFKPWVDGQGVSFPALGFFSHEALCVDPVRKMIYMTEDADGGRVYRFECAPSDWPAGASRPALQTGQLKVLQVTQLPPDTDPSVPQPSGTVNLLQPTLVKWVDVASPGEPQKSVRDSLRSAGTAPPGHIFPKAEGMWFYNGMVFFATSLNHRIWACDTQKDTLQIIYSGTPEQPELYALNRPDNITVTQFGDILASEDGGNLEICVVRPDGTSQAVLRLLGHDKSEITGPAITPDGRRLYFSSQRGTSSESTGLEGMTFEVLLPKMV